MIDSAHTHRWWCERAASNGGSLISPALARLVVALPAKTWPVVLFGCGLLAINNKHDGPRDVGRPAPAVRQENLLGQKGKGETEQPT